MDKRTIFELRDYISNKIIYFCEYYKNENILETSFSNWNVRDVIGHINSWIKFSMNNLEAIKLNQPLENGGRVNVEMFNKNNYEKYKNKTLENVINESKMILEKYGNIFNSFNEEEIFSNVSPVGSSPQLWKGMAMDLCIHPLTHIMKHYLMKRDYNEFIKEIESSKKYFLEYSGNDMKVYFLWDLFEDKEEKKRRYKELKEIGKGNKFIEEIIKINME
jgi:hypothetical protein